jgi:DNA-binding NarL/FixJ family response regulator
MLTGCNTAASGATARLRVLIADDHALVRAGFRMLVASLGHEVVAEAGDGLEALRLIPECAPDLVLMDISMPGLNGIDATARIHERWPETRVLILSMHSSPDYARRALAAGAAGYLVKDASAAELELAIRAVARGESYLSPVVSTHVVAGYVGRSDADATRLERLSPRQRQVLRMMAEGCSRREIADDLHISAKTVDTYRRQILDHLGVKDNARLVRFAIRTGLASEL